MNKSDTTDLFIIKLVRSEVNILALYIESDPVGPSERSVQRCKRYMLIRLEWLNSKRISKGI